MPSAEERFRRRVARGADHDLWTGAQTASGTGVVRIDGALTTVQRAAWELAHGLLPAGARVLSCPQFGPASTARLAISVGATGRVCVSATCAWRAIASRRRHENDAGRSAGAAPSASCGPGCGA